MYLKRTTIYRDRIEIDKYHTSRYGVKGEKRNKRQRPTEETVKRANERASIRRLKGILIENFDTGDYHLTLTYNPKNRPDVETSRQMLKKFFRDLRKAYKAAGIELKYVVTTEWQSKTIHHHVVINNVDNFAEIITKAWPYGGKYMTPLYPDHNYDGLAEYLVKETCETFRDPACPYKQRWTCSRNLKHPEEKIEVISSGTWRDDPTVPKSLQQAGYTLDTDSIDNGVDMFGYQYQRYTLRKYHTQTKNKKELKT